ncbi:hypothetical protein Goklo_007135 [Gossypium klotzschianum]|uniref:Uncharacterized protein n=1 Tax=Gossypium klotzschianum TaxID=34286 RepID=A0A7J8VKW0_9ROSI|nr:hypothetical protein [Gossypium klotzschianum]
MAKLNEAAAMEIDDPNSNISDQNQPQVLDQCFAKFANRTMTWTPAGDVGDVDDD